MLFYVYSYRLNGVPIYIGKGKGDRAHSHKVRVLRKGETRFYRKLRALLEEGKTVDIIFEELNLQEDAAYALEIDLIKRYGRLGIDPGGVLYNSTPGGDSPPSMKGARYKWRWESPLKGKPGRPWSKDSKNAHSRRMRMRMQDPETIRKCSVAKLGKPGNRHSEESKKKISIAQSKPSEAKRLSKLGDKNPNRGKRWYSCGLTSKLFSPAEVPSGWSLGRLGISLLATPPAPRPSSRR